MTISEALKQDAWSEESNLPLVLLTINHAILTEPIRVVNNRVDITSNGYSYIAFPFEIMLPDSQEDAAPRAKVRISNVSREIGQNIRLMDSYALVDISVVRQDTPDTVEVAFTGMRTGAITYDASMVEFELEFENLMREPYPAVSFSPAEFPGLTR